MNRFAMNRFATCLILMLGTTLAWAGQDRPDGGLMRMDSDGDGRVSREEFQPPSSHRGPRIMEKADLDGDGSVTRDEVLAAIDDAAEEKKKRMGGQMLLMFEEADRDNDGVLTQEEALEHVFSRADADGDGFITAEEAQQMRDRRGGKHGRRGSR